MLVAASSSRPSRHDHHRQADGPHSCGQHFCDHEHGHHGDACDDNDTESDENFWTANAFGSGWVSLPIVSGAQRGRILAVSAAGIRNTRFYVLDEIGAGEKLLRLQELTLAGGLTEILRWRSDNELGSFSMTGAYDGGLLISQSYGNRHQFTHLAIADGTVREVSQSDGPDAVAVPPYVRRDGVAWGGAASNDRVAARRTTSEDFSTVFRACGSVGGEASVAYQPQAQKDFDATLRSKTPLVIPATLAVAHGNTGNAQATLTLTNGASQVVCTYHGNDGSQTEQPAPPQFVFAFCSDGARAGTPVETTHVHLSVQAASGAGATVVRFALAEQATGRHAGSRFGTLTSSCH